MGLKDLFNKLIDRKDENEQEENLPEVTLEMVLQSIDHCKQDVVMQTLSNEQIAAAAACLDEYQMKLRGISPLEGKKVGGLYQGLQTLFDQKMRVVITNPSQPQFVDAFDVVSKAIEAIGSREQSQIDRYVVLLQKICYQAAMFEIDQNIARLNEQVAQKEQRIEAVKKDPEMDYDAKAAEIVTVQGSISIIKSSIAQSEAARKECVKALDMVTQTLESVNIKGIVVDRTQFQQVMDAVHGLEIEEFKEMVNNTDDMAAKVQAKAERIEEIMRDHVDVREMQMAQQLRMEAEQQKAQQTQTDAPASVEAEQPQSVNTIVE